MAFNQHERAVKTTISPAAAATAASPDNPSRSGRYANRNFNHRTRDLSGPLDRAPEETLTARIPASALSAAVAVLAGLGRRRGSRNNNTLRLGRSKSRLASKRGAGETGNDQSSENGLHNQKLLKTNKPLTHTRAPECVSYHKRTCVYSPVRGGPVSQPAPDQPS